MSSGRHTAPARARTGPGAVLRALAPAGLLLAVGVVAVVCLLTLDALGTGGRIVGTLIALWALGVGALGVRHGLRSRPDT